MDNVTIKFEMDDFFNVINAMRDHCGCNTCMRITNDMIEQRIAQ